MPYKNELKELKDRVDRMNTVKASFLNLCKNGDFAGLKFGQSTKSIIKKIGKPDSIWEDSNADIWTYGNVELFIYENRLQTIFSDHFYNNPKKPLYGTKRLKIDPWLLQKPKKSSLQYVLKQLNKQGIDYIKKSHDYAITLLLPSGVVLHFEDVDSSEPLKNKNVKNNQANNFLLQAFSYSDSANALYRWE